MHHIVLHVYLFSCYITYLYDSLNRLTRENNADIGKTIVYTYDDRNNLTSRVEHEFTTASTLESPLSTTTFNLGDWKDQITSITKDGQSTALSYDDKGRLTAFGNNAFTWDDNGRLTSVTNGSNCTQYLYDGDGNRVGKLFNETSLTEFSYINGKLIKLSKVQETNPYSLIFLHDSTGIIGFKYNGEVYTYRKNLFGDITEIYKGTELVAKYAYDAWGNCTILQNNDDIANVNPFRYRGYYYDTETELYYLKSRYYSPKLCRFISPDGIEYLEPDNIHGLNLYTYCVNNPIMFSDPSGNMPEWLQSVLNILGAAGIVVGVTALTVLTVTGLSYILGASSIMTSAIATGATIGGLLTGSLEIGAQIYKNGINDIDLTSVGIESFIGSLFGAITGATSVSSSAVLNLKIRGARVVIGTLGQTLHGINGGYTTDQIVLNAIKSAGLGLIMQGMFAGLDAYTGKLSNSVLQLYNLDGALSFGSKQILSMSAILFGKNVWRNKTLFFNW